MTSKITALVILALAGCAAPQRPHYMTTVGFDVACISGPNTCRPPGCLLEEGDFDGDIDLRDWSIAIAVHREWMEETVNPDYWARFYEFLVKGQHCPDVWTYGHHDPRRWTEAMP